MRRVLLAAVFVLTACSSGSDSGDIAEKAKPLPSPTTEAETINLENGLYKAFPHSIEIEQGTPYKFRIYTHCGLGFVPIDFDGSFWDFESGVDDRQGVAPEGFDDPFDSGVMTLIEEDRAEFDNLNGGVVTFTRHDGPNEFGVCA